MADPPGSADGQTSQSREHRVPQLVVNHVRTESALERELKWYHVVFICISGTVGAGLYVRSGILLEVAGAGAVLVAFLVLGLLAVLIMRTIGEMILIWPIPNALVLFVREFVDEELSNIVAVAYWFTNSIGFAALLAAAAFEATAWTHSSPVQGVVFLLVPAVVILGLACLRVKYYGWIEVFGGVVKLLFVVVVLVAMIVILCKHPAILPGDSPSNFHNSTTFFTHNPAEAKNESIAIIMALPIAAYAFVGIEIPAVLALEVELDHEPASNGSPSDERNQQPALANYALHFSVKWLPALISAVYLTAGMLASANVSPRNPRLPNTVLTPSSNASSSNSSSIFIIAADMFGYQQLGTAFTVFFVLTAWSAALTTLYLSSRTLFAATRDLAVPSLDQEVWQGWRQADQWLLAWLKLLLKFCGKATRRNSVPFWALLVSALAFIWLPTLYVVRAQSVVVVVNVLDEMGALCCLFVWACECLAYIQFYRNLYKHREEIRQSSDSDMSYIRRDWDNSNYPWLALGQPGVAIAAMTGCTFIIVVASGSPIWRGWKGRETEFVAAYVPLLLFIVAWLVQKLYNKGVRWSPEELELQKQIKGENRANERSLWFGYPLSNWEHGFKPALERLNVNRRRRQVRG